MKKSASLPFHILSQTNEAFLKNLPTDTFPHFRIFEAANEMVLRSTKTYNKPDFGITEIEKENSYVNVREMSVFSRPFCNLTYFKRTYDGNLVGACEPKVLIVAPLSGHYATLLRDTVQSMCVDHNVYITDWVDAQLVPHAKGPFDLSTYVEYLLSFVEFMGTEIHIMAVCQPVVPVLMTSALLAQAPSKPQLKSMILMGGPVDPRVNPGAVNHFAQQHSIEWFKENVISTVPAYHKGHGRSVCPGFLMLSGFMNMNLERHQDAFLNMFQNLVQGDEESAEKHRKFYDEYRAVMDLPAEYFLESVQKVFQEFRLPTGTMTWRGKTIDLTRIEKTALFTIEGQLDDISCVGQTYAAQTLCKNIPKHLRHHYEQKGVGHYGIFNGSKWRQQIQPQIKNFIASVDP